MMPIVIHIVQLDLKASLLLLLLLGTLGGKLGGGWLALGLAAHGNSFAHVSHGGILEQ